MKTGRARESGPDAEQLVRMVIRAVAVVAVAFAGVGITASGMVESAKRLARYIQTGD